MTGDRQRGTTRGRYPLAVLAIKQGKYSVEDTSSDSRHMTVVKRGYLVVADVRSPGEALAWIQDKEAALLAKRQATVRP